jgi:putative GTP pyrophosphokinase
MSSLSLPETTIAEIKEMVAIYTPRRVEFANLAKRVETDLVEHEDLRPLIHSTKKREKDPEHLFDKLARKACEALEANKPFAINKDNLFKKVGDLAGVRLLHIHTDQLATIHPAMVKILKFHGYKMREKPLVYIWDLERKEFLKKLDLKVIVRENMYTSVHYIVEPFWQKIPGEKIACEIQVRTLAEELWGEVSHKINYPHETESIACKQQLAALARLASGCTRLVDSIYASKTEHDAKSQHTAKEVITDAGQTSSVISIKSDSSKPA